VPIHGRALIEWIVGTARDAGLRQFRIVTGYLGEELREFVRSSPRLAGVDVRFVHNPDWERANGISVACAADLLPGPFVLLMSDHLFAGEILAGLLAEPLGDDEVILAVDRRLRDHPTVDLDDVTRVLVEDGRIVAIGKGLAKFNAFDTGIFFCTPALFDALAESSQNGDDSLSGGIRVLARRGKARVFDIGGSLWVDVDDEAAFARAEKHFGRRAASG
jgi:1L-myo-inositol 1-phosphate cytidylyltransferase